MINFVVTKKQNFEQKPDAVLDLKKEKLYSQKKWIPQELNGLNLKTPVNLVWRLQHFDTKPMPFWI